MYCKDYTINLIVENKLVKRYQRFMTETEAQEYMQKQIETYKVQVIDVSRFSENYQVSYYLFCKKI